MDTITLTSSEELVGLSEKFDCADVGKLRNDILTKNEKMHPEIGKK